MSQKGPKPGKVRRNSKGARESLGFEIQSDTPDTRGVKRKTKMGDEACSKCGVGLLSDTVYISCTLCEDKYCKTCSKITDDTLWNFLRSRKTRGVSWTCTPCENSGGLKSLDRITKKIEEQTSQMCEMKQDLNKKIDEQTVTLHQIIEKKISEKFAEEKTKMVSDVKASVMEEVKGNIEDSVEKAITKAIQELLKPETQLSGEKSLMQLSPGSQMKRTVSRISSELEERAKRKNNIVVLGLEEHSSIIKEECIKKDIEKISKFSKDILKVTFSNTDIKDIRRLGLPRQDNKDTDENREKRRPRAILIQLNSSDKKDQLMRNAPKLKNSTHSHIAIRHDQTQLEREEFNKLRSKAQELESQDTSGNYVYRVRGPPGHKKIYKIEILPEGQEGERTEMSSM